MIMECKSIRAEDRQRKLNLNQLNRHRATLGKLHTTNLHLPTPIVQRYRQTTKAHQHQREIKIYDENGKTTGTPTGSLTSEEGSESLVSSPPPPPNLSLADVMVPKPQRKACKDSFEFIQLPISRVIVLGDEDEEDEDDQAILTSSRNRFPDLRKSKKTFPRDDHGWEKIGMDGEIEGAEDQISSTNQIIKKSWLEALLGNKANSSTATTEAQL